MSDTASTYSSNSTSNDPNSQSFWEIGKYSRVVERVENGHLLCDELVACMKEREQLEKAYAKSLVAWSKKWDTWIEKSPEFGSLRDGWKAMFTEATGVAEAHTTMANQLAKEVQDNIDKWSKDKYHKSIIHFKEVKLAEEGFEKAQKQWAKLKGKVEKAKKAYHAAARIAATLQKRYLESEKNPSFSTDDIYKLNEKAKKAAAEADVLKQKYQENLRIITEYNPKYVEEMTGVFEKWQQFEQSRIDFFKQTLVDYHRIMDVSNNRSIATTYSGLSGTVGSIDSGLDLRNFSDQQGAGMPYRWPEFEEFIADDFDLSSSESMMLNTPATRTVSSLSTGSAGSGSSSTPPPKPVTSKPLIGQASQDTFDDDWEGSRSNSAASASGGGTRVRALYDYDASDPEEISFKEGDIIIQVTAEDDQGWCRGTFKGKTGLYPASYCETI